MSYRYEDEKADLMTDSGQRVLLRVFRNAIRLNLRPGKRIFTMAEVTEGISGSNWTAMAAVDRLVELRCLREEPSFDDLTQNRQFYCALS